MTDQPDGPRQSPLAPADLAAGEKYAGPHDPGSGEEYAGEPVSDPWDLSAAGEEVSDGELDPGAVPGDVAQ